MADEKERIVYEFYGDTQSLKSMTKEAISLLDRFQSKMDMLNSAGIVKASQRAQSGFNNSVNKMTKDITKLQRKLGSIGDVKLPRGSEAFNASKVAVDALTNTLTKLTFSSTITSKSLNELKTGLNNATAGLKSAGPTFDTLISKEEKFQQRLASIDSVANQFSTKLYGATDKVKSSFDTMGASVGAKLRDLGSKFEPLVAKIQGFKDKADIAGNRITQVFATVSAAFRRTTTDTDNAASSQSRFGKALDSIKEKLNNHRNKLKETSVAYEDMEESASEAYNSMSAGTQAFTKTLGGIKSAIAGVVDSFFALAGVESGDILSKGAESAIDYVENMNLFQVAMGSSISKGKAFVNQMQEVYGMDPSNIARYAGYFYQLTDAIGMSEEASASVSLSMTKAANDIASLFNEDIQTVVDNLASGMQGMSRAVRKYGMDIRATTLQQTALKYGIQGEVETMSEANREALRYITMLEQVQNALDQTTTATDGTSTTMGDFARNIETPANQLRIFKEQMSQLGRAIGNFIVVPLQKALPYINGFVMALRTLVNFLAAIMGVAVKAGNSLDSAGESAEDAASGVGSIGSAADKASKKLKQLIAPFDELNVLQESSGGSDDSLIGGGALDPNLAKVLAEMELNLENIQMKANQVRDAILGFLGIEVTTDPITGDQIIQWNKEAFMSNVMGSLDVFKAWFEDLSPIAQSAAVIAGVVAGFALFPGVVGLAIDALGLLLISSDSFRTAFTELFGGVGTSILEWGTILAGVFTLVGTDIVAMWETHIAPTIAAIGDALAPALETLGSLWNNLSAIISNIFLLISTLWTTVLKPVIEGALKIIQDLANKFQILWENYVGPVFEHIGNGLEDLWINTFSPIMVKIMNLIGEFWALMMALWNTVLSPLIDWLIGVFGPLFQSVFTGLWNVIKPIIANIGAAVGGMIDIFTGVIKFLTGVFTGDWKKAWEGIKQIFKGVWDTFSNIAKAPINVIIGLVNNLISGIESGLNWIISGLNRISFSLPSWVPGVGGLSFGINLAYANFGRIPYLATGGVVTGPTPAMIGEGKYSEAVIPLEDSPQMNDLINKIVAAIDKDKDTNSSPVEVRVYIGDKEYDAYTYKASERGKKIVGKQPVKIGG